MKLLTKALEKKMPPLYAQDGKGDDAIAFVKFFCPWNQWTWYGLEFDPEERVFFGWIEGMEKELGYFALDELAAVRGPFGLKIERDMHFDPQPLGALK